MWLNTVRFKDRLEAGGLLVDQLISDQVISESKKKNLLILAIPRGGVVVGKVVADRLGLPLGVVVTKKVGAPGQEELAVGAMGPDGRVVWDRALLERLNLDTDELAAQIKNAKLKIKNYLKKFEKVRPCSIAGSDLNGKTVILVDDGVATGATMKTAMVWLRRQGVAKIVMAVPVCAQEAYGELIELADEVVCLLVPEDFGAVGQFYEHFPQVTDEEVVAILRG